MDRKIERIGISGRYRTENLPRNILNSVSDGLTSIDKEGKPIPSLALSWESKDDGKVWEFKLDTTRKWQDGKLLTSESIVYEFSDAEIERPDESTIIFKLEDPFSPFPTVVSKPTFRKGLLGTGKWEVKNILVTGNFVSELSLINENDDLRIYRFYPTEEQTKLAFKMGHIDSIRNELDPPPLDTWMTVDTNSKSDLSKVVTLFFNTQDSILGDKSVRQALVYALDKENFYGDRALGPISPDSWAYNSQVKKYAYDIDRARDLLSDTPDELLAQPINIVSSPLLLPIAEKVSESWREIGINSIVQVSSIIPDEFQVYLTIFDIPSDPDQYPFWHSTQKLTNISNYGSPRIDKLLEDGRTELDETERKKIYFDFQRFLLEDSPAAFLFHPEVYSLNRK